MLVAGKNAFSNERSQTSLPNKKSKTNCLPKNQIYLDSYLTYISFFNQELLEVIHEIDTLLLGHTNAGTYKTKWMVNYGDVEAWIDVSGIANTLSIPALKKLGYYIIYESDDGYYLLANRKTDVATKFTEDNNGLLYLEATKEGVMFFRHSDRTMRGSPRKKWRRLYLLARTRDSLGTHMNKTSSTW